MNILGVSALYHDSAACLVRDGDIVAAAQEERFTRKKHDSGVPYHAMLYCLAEGGVRSGELDGVAFYEKPLTKFTRLLSTTCAVSPRGFRTFAMGVPTWLKEKAWTPLVLERFLHRQGFGRPGRWYFPEHHLSHAASAFYPCPFDEAAVMTVDGVGEWATYTMGVGEGNQVRLIYEQRFPHSLGMLYSAFTYFTGFKVNSGEYKLMGLSPYGEPAYVEAIRKHLVEIHEDGSFRLNMKYFGYLDGLTMTNGRFARLFGGPARKPETDITKREMDLACSIQVVTEEILVKAARYLRAISGKRRLCLAGGVALNCVANGKLLASGIFDDLWIQPAAGDAGGALGAALYTWYQVGNHPRDPQGRDAMKGSLLGPAWSNDRIRQFLDARGLPYRFMEETERNACIARSISEQRTVAICQGRMEYGPRALCNRSIIADARSPRMQSYLNLSTKFRESFRPFAPAVLREDTQLYFDHDWESPYMLLVDQVRPERLLPAQSARQTLSLKDWVNTPRSDVPAITHVDNSARVQTVDPVRHPRMHAILREFKELTGCSLVVNTSFNVRGEPIVCTPEDAYRCFMRTGLDVLVLENCVLEKREQPAWHEMVNWKEEFVLD